MDVDIFIPKYEMSKEARAKLDAHIESTKIKVLAFNKDTGELLHEFNSVTDAANYYKTSSSNVSRTCKGLINYLKGCLFIYKKDYDPNKIYKYEKVKKSIPEKIKRNMSLGSSRSIKVQKFDEDGNFIEEYNSINYASKCNSLPESVLKNKILSHYNGFVYKILRY